MYFYKLRRFALVVAAAVLLSGCGVDDDLEEITPAASEPVQETKEDTRVTTDDDDVDTPLTGHSIDYGMDSNWLHVAGREDDGDDPKEDSKEENAGEKKSGSVPLKDVDTFYIYPTVYADASEDAPSIQEDIGDEARERARDVYERQATLFESSTNVYAPFYRQTNLAEYSKLDKKEIDAFQMAEQRTDIYSALDYYFTNYNEGRPFILAGHSQGAMMVKQVLIEYMDAHRELYDRMVAAYVIGWSVTEEDLAEYPHLKFAESSDDTGVIISYNTEGKKNKDSFVVLDGAMAINPISWTTDTEKAVAENNLGSRIYNEKEKRYEILSNLADAAIDEDRGVVVCSTKPIEYDSVPGDLLGKKSYHSHDIDLYYENLRHNVQERSEAFLQSETTDKGE